MRFIREAQLNEKTGQSNAKNRRDVQHGLLPPSIRYGLRNIVWPEHEIDAVIAARIAGKTDEEIREFVTKLVKARTKALDVELQNLKKRSPCRHNESDGG